MVNEQGFNPSQLDEVNDVVQRAGFSDKRKRNLAIRSGMENPGAFQEQNAGYVQEAQQPSEFVGAGRQLAANQNPDQGIASIFNGALAKHGTDWYSYGDTDYSTAQFGTNGYKLKDAGLGSYDILGKDGNSIGKSYGSVTNAINAYARANWQPTTPINESAEYSEWGPTGGKVYSYGGDEWSGPQRFSTYDDALNSMMAQYGIGNYKPRGYWDTAGKLEDWEILGQVLQGNLQYAGGFGDSYRHMPGDNQAQNISGLNTLFDSQPLIHNDKLLGYKLDLGPNANDGSQGHLAGYQNPFHISRQDPKGNTRSNYQLWRDIGETDAWNKVGMFTGQGEDFFVPVDNASKLPGWTQGDTSQYSHKSSGIGSKLASLVGTGLSIFGGPLAPIGYAINTAAALNNNNPLGALASIFGGAMNISGADLAGAAGVDQAVGGGFSGADLVDFATPSATLAKAFSGINPSLVSGAIGAGSSALKGQNPLLGGLGAGLGNFASGQLQTLFGNNTLGNIVGGAANTGVKSLFNQNQTINGSEQGAHSGSLSGFINNNSPSAQNTQEPSQEEKQQMALDLQRKLIQRRQQEQLGGA